MSLKSKLQEKDEASINDAMPKKTREIESWPEVLKAWRARRNITQKEAADRLGVPLSTYRRWEQATSRPIFPTPEAAADVFKP